MNKTVGILSATTALFAASTLYLAWQVGAERDRGLSLVASGASAGTRVAARAPSANSHGHTGADGMATGADAQANERATIAGLSDQSAATSAGGRRRRPPPGLYNELMQKEFLRMSQDPVARRQLIEEEIPNLRDQFLKLERRLHIASDQWQRFLETVAEQSLDVRGIFATCGNEPECVKRTFTADLNARRQQQIRDVLGESDAKQYETFNYSMGERQNVEALQTRLPKFQQLSEKTSEDLIVALSDVRRETEKHLNADGAKIGVVRGEGVMIFYPQELKTLDERLAYASAHMAELRKRAGTLLNGAQLATYDELQGLAFRTITRALQSQSKNGS